MIPTNTKKRQRVPHHTCSTRYSSADSSQKLCRSTSATSFNDASGSDVTLLSTSFNDSSTADVILRLYVDINSPFSSDSALEDDVQIYVHSHILCRSKYFAALLSDRWQNAIPNNAVDSDNDKKVIFLNFGVSSNKPNSISDHLTVLQLLYTEDFSSVINTVSVALDLLPVALELLFEDCVKACVKFIEAVPWTEEEETRVIEIIPLLREEESKELLSRVSPTDNSCENMLHGLILAAIHNHPNMAFVKAFVAKLLRDFASRESARRVLEKAFEESLKVVKESLEEYSSPDFRGDHNETEAIQRLNLHTAMTNGRHLLWLVERMIELRVADSAVKEWSEQAVFTADLQRAFRDDAWRNIVPGLPAVVMRCTCKLATAVAAGTILAARQVGTLRCRENISSVLSIFLLTMVIVWKISKG
ncbi:BTB/POZ domain-containing protein [Melia azedarach]|uniref:BTB/POZ domain-containing protein n=1 Tax=Melia azedarach TaxID=155640 RepID=A0ACC1Y005_MELAZ|nr:BTB/POZ domain-containing protein [Melia azedarach]